MTKDISQSRNGYHYQYDETGGYDCMTGAFWVLDPAGKTVCEIDLRHYGQRTCTEPTPEMMLAAQKVAIDVVSALNRAQFDESFGEKLKRPLPVAVMDAISNGPTGDERLNDEWKRREMFAQRIARLAYAIGLSEAVAPSESGDSKLLREWFKDWQGEMPSRMRFEFTSIVDVSHEREGK